MISDELVRLIEREHLSVAIAESMSGGELALAFAEVPGSSEWFKGGFVAYDATIKHDLLGVDPGPVISAAAATQMATGVARLLDADVGIATTGCSGPEPMEGHPVGTLYVGVSVWDHCTSTHQLLAGGPDDIRRATIGVALAHAASTVADAWSVPQHASA